jgi:hypothetical protein
VPDHYCEGCGNVDNECRCDAGCCSTCGEPLSAESLELDRDQCFDCYLSDND